MQLMYTVYLRLSAHTIPPSESLLKRPARWLGRALSLGLLSCVFLTLTNNNTRVYDVSTCIQRLLLNAQRWVSYPLQRQLKCASATLSFVPLKIIISLKKMLRAYFWSLFEFVCVHLGRWRITGNQHVYEFMCTHMLSSHIHQTNTLPSSHIQLCFLCCRRQFDNLLFFFPPFSYLILLVIYPLCQWVLSDRVFVTRQHLQLRR